MGQFRNEYSYLMTPEYIAYNESKQRMKDRLDFEKQLAQMKKEIIAELKPFIEQAASKSIEYQVQNNALPALKDLDKAIKNLGHL